MEGLLSLDIEDPRWTRLVAANPAAGIFHQPAWSHLLAECYGYRPFALVLTDEHEQAVAGLPVIEVKSHLTGHRFVSLPFTDYCAPLTTGGVTPGRLAEALAREPGIVGDLEIRAALPEMPGVYASPIAVRHTLELGPDEDKILASFNKTHRRNIGKGEEAGVRIVREDSPAGIAAFYHLHLESRRRLGVPIQPRRFFDLLGARVLRAGLGFVLLAYVGDRPVAGAVFLMCNGTLTYKYGASDSRYWKLRPNNLLLWTAIRWACQNGYHTFDLGRSDWADQGLRDFKSRWGAREEPLVYSRIADHPQWPSNERAKQILSLVIRHSPLSVCWVIGELLYGHFG